MVSGLVTLTLVLALGQSPPPAEAAWLKALPGDVEMAMHVRGLGTVKDDLASMLKAMSPSAEQSLVPRLDAALQDVRRQIGEDVLPSNSPILTVARLPKPGQDPGPQGPPFLTLGAVKNYEALLKAGFSLKNPKTKKEAGGFESTTGPDEMGVEQTIYSYKGTGFAAVSNDEALMKAVAKPSGRTLDTKIRGEVATAFFGGDVGLYVDLATIQESYGDQIEQIRQSLPPGPQGVNTNFLFDALKSGQGLSFHLDFAADGLLLSGIATVKEGSAAAKKLANPRSGTGEIVGRMPEDASLYLYTNADPDTFERLTRQSLQITSGGAENDSPELKKAFDLQREAGIQESVTAVTMKQGMRTIAVMMANDPKKLMEGVTAVAKAQKAGGGQGVIKEVSTAPDAETYKQFRFNRTKMTLDLERMAQMQPTNPGGVEALRKMYGGDTLTSWTGTDGKRVLMVMAKDWNEAKSMIDRVVSESVGLGASASYKAMRARFPAKVGSLFLFSAQGALQALASQLGAMSGREAQVPGDVPKPPAYLGGALTRTPAGFQFQFVVPRDVGPVVEKGFIPLFQSVQGVNQ
jgi:hypothetical protein